MFGIQLWLLAVSCTRTRLYTTEELVDLFLWVPRAAACVLLVYPAGFIGLLALECVWRVGSSYFSRRSYGALLISASFCVFFFSFSNRTASPLEHMVVAYGRSVVSRVHTRLPLGSCLGFVSRNGFSTLASRRLLNEFSSIVGTSQAIRQSCSTCLRSPAYHPTNCVRLATTERSASNLVGDFCGGEKSKRYVLDHKMLYRAPDLLREVGWYKDALKIQTGETATGDHGVRCRFARHHQEPQRVSNNPDIQCVYSYSRHPVIHHPDPGEAVNISPTSIVSTNLLWPSTTSGERCATPIASTSPCGCPLKISTSPGRACRVFRPPLIFCHNATRRLVLIPAAANEGLGIFSCYRLYPPRFCRYRKRARQGNKQKRVVRGRWRRAGSGRSLRSNKKGNRYLGVDTEGNALRSVARFSTDYSKYCHKSSPWNAVRPTAAEMFAQ